MSSVLFSLPGRTLGELVLLETSYFMCWELHTHWGKDSRSAEWAGRPQGLQLLLKVSLKHLRTLPWSLWTLALTTPFKQKHWRQRGSSKARVSQSVTGSHCVSGGLAVSSTEDARSVRRRRRASDPPILSEREAQTRGTPFSSYEEIRSGNIIGKKNL